MVISSGPSSAGAVDLVGEPVELGDRGPGVVEVLEEAVPPVAAGHGPAASRRRHAAGQDRRTAGPVRLRPALDAAERREVAAELGLGRRARACAASRSIRRPGVPGCRTAPRWPRTRRARTRRRCRPSADRATARRRWRAPWPGSPGCATAGSRCRCRAGSARWPRPRSASTGTGSMSSECDGNGDGGTCGSISTGCSPTQIDSKPSASAVRATVATPSASASAPEPTPNHPIGIIGYAVRMLLVAACLRAPDVRPDVDEEREDHDEPPEAGDALGSARTPPSTPASSTAGR